MFFRFVFRKKNKNKNKKIEDKNGTREIETLT